MILMRGPPLASADYLGISLGLETSLPLGGGEVFTHTFNNSLCRHLGANQWVHFTSLRANRGRFSLSFSLSLSFFFCKSYDEHPQSLYPHSCTGIFIFYLIFLLFKNF